MTFDPPVPRTVDEFSALSAVPELNEATDRATIALPIGPSGAICPVVPNIQDWRAGDLLLYRSPPRLLPSPVRLYQALLADIPPGFHPYTHVGLYDGSGHVWEANPKENIRVSTVSDFLGKGCGFRVFRLKDIPVPADAMLRQCRFLRDTRRYPRYIDFVSPAILSKLTSRAIRRGRAYNDSRQVLAESLVCSSFVFHVLNIATKLPIQINKPFIVPADFADETLFDPVACRWHRAAPPEPDAEA